MLEARLEYVGHREKMVGPKVDGNQGRLYAYIKPTTSLSSVIEQWREDFDRKVDFRHWPDYDGVAIREAINTLLTPIGWMEKLRPVDFPRHFNCNGTTLEDEKAIAVLLIVWK